MNSLNRILVLLFILTINTAFCQNAFDYSSDAMALFTQVERDSLNSKLDRITSLLEVNIAGHVKTSYPYLAYADGRIAYLKAMEDELDAMSNVGSNITMAVAYDYEGKSTYADVSISLPNSGILSTANSGVIAMIEEDFTSTFTKEYKNDFYVLNAALNRALDQLYLSLDAYSNNTYNTVPQTEAQLTEMGFAKIRLSSDTITFSFDESKKQINGNVQDHIGLMITSPILNTSDKLLSDQFGVNLDASGVTFISSKSGQGTNGSSYSKAFQSEKRAASESFWIHILDGVAYVRVNTKMKLSAALAYKDALLKENLRTGRLFTTSQYAKNVGTEDQSKSSCTLSSIVPKSKAQFMAWSLKKNVMSCFPNSDHFNNIPPAFNLLKQYTSFQLDYSAGACYALGDGLLGYVKIAVFGVSVLTDIQWYGGLKKGLESIKVAAVEDKISKSDSGSNFWENVTGIGLSLVLGPWGFEAAKFLYPLINMMKKAVVFIFDMMKAMLVQVVNLVQDLAFVNGVKAAGYALGTIIFEVASEVLTAGSSRFLKSGLDKFLGVFPSKVTKMTKKAKKNSKCRVPLLGCFVKNTPVLVANKNYSNSYKANFGNTAKAMVFAASMPIVAVPIQDVQLLDYAVAHETVNATYGMTASTDDDIYLGLAEDPYTSDQQRERDEYEINNTDWNEVVFEEVLGGSTAKLALHNSWINQKGYEVDAIVEMNLPEQGISGPFRITSIKHIIPQKKPVDDDEADEYGYKPVTALFTHESNQVFNISFDNGDKLGVTYRHPIYSTSVGDWKLAGQLELGEEVLTKYGNVKVVSSTRKGGSETVYNLEVKDLHNFLAGKSGILVHNECTISELWGFLKDRLFKPKQRYSGIPGKMTADESHQLAARLLGIKESFRNRFVAALREGGIKGKEAIEGMKKHIKVLNYKGGFEIRYGNVRYRTPTNKRQDKYQSNFERKTNKDVSWESIDDWKKNTNQVRDPPGGPDSYFNTHANIYD